MQQIKSILQKKHYHVLESSYICYIAQKTINQLFNTNEVSVISYKQKKLKLKANQILISELRLRQSEIIAKINQDLKNNKIDKITY